MIDIISIRWRYGKLEAEHQNQGEQARKGQTACVEAGRKERIGDRNGPPMHGMF
jgi:hypothetical protein